MYAVLSPQNSEWGFDFEAPFDMVRLKNVEGRLESKKMSNQQPYIGRVPQAGFHVARPETPFFLPLMKCPVEVDL